MSVEDGLEGDAEREDKGDQPKTSIIVQQRDDENLEPRLRQENEEKGIVSRDTEEADSVGLCGQ